MISTVVFIFPFMWQLISLHLKSVSVAQSYYEITSNAYLAFIRNYVIGIGPWKDTIVPTKDNYLEQPTDLVARAHALNLQVTDLIRQLHISPWLHKYYPWCGRQMTDAVNHNNIAGASVHFQKWEFILALQLPSRPLCRIRILAQWDRCRWAVHWFYW